jgi:16S rRNA (guanine1516-N2)-methyltransferase
MCKRQLGDKTELLLYAKPGASQEMVRFAEDRTKISATHHLPKTIRKSIIIQIAENGISLIRDNSLVQGDFSKMRPRLIPANLNGELLIKAAKMKGTANNLTAIDATAGLGEDAFLLAAFGYKLSLYERDPIISLLLQDAINRAFQQPDLQPIAARMTLHFADSIPALSKVETPPDIVLLDPMFPNRKKKRTGKKEISIASLSGKTL